MSTKDIVEEERLKVLTGEEPAYPASQNGRVHLFNLIWLSVGFFLLFSAFNGTSNILTSLDATVGFRTSAILYAAFCLGSLLFSTSVVSSLGPKWSIFIGALSYTLFQGANLKQEWQYMYPAAGILGLGASVLWAAQGSYVTIAASNYASANLQSSDTSQGFFQGSFFGIFQINQVVGNLTSGFIFLYAGSSSVNILFYVFLGISAAGLIVLLLLKPEREKMSVQDDETALSRITAVFKIHLDYKMLLLIPITYYNGLEQGFIMGDFTSLTKSSLDEKREWVGFSMAVFGVVNAISSVIAGRMIRKFGIFVAILGTIAHAAFFAFIIWSTKQEALSGIYHSHRWILFLVAAIAGVGDAIATTYPNTLIGTLFGDRTMAAFSAMKLWNSLGNVTILLIGINIDVWWKACIVASFLFLSILFSVILDFIRRRQATYAAYQSL